MDKVQWNPRTVLEEQDFKVGQPEGTSPVYREVLGKCPVAYVDASAVDENAAVGYWGIFGYDELIAAAKDFKTFSSVTPVSGPRVLPLQADPPEHAQYRTILNPFFRREVIAAFEPTISAYGRTMLDEVIAKGEADFAQEFAFPFPTRVLCTFLGVPEDDWQIHHDWVMAMEHATKGGLLSPAEAIPPELGARIVPYIQKVIAERRITPGDDVITGIINAEIDGRPVDDMTATYLVMTIMMAGHVTTTSAIGNIVTRLARDTQLQDHLRAHPHLVPAAVEESLRIDGPQQGMPRRCVRDTEVSGQKIQAGDYVVLNFGSANVDPNHWPDPATFDLDRQEKRHLAFGRGLHLCIGQHLARLEITFTVQELLARTESFALSSEVSGTFWPLTTIEHLPLTMVARAAD